MKHFLVNLLGELPILLILAACYIIMDRAMFGNRLSGLIRAGWRSKMRPVHTKRPGVGGT